MYAITDSHLKTFFIAHTPLDKNGMVKDWEMQASVPVSNTGRKPGDHRSAKEITESPRFQSLTLEFKNDPQLQALFMQQVGGDWTDKSFSERERADIAANAERVLDYIDQVGLKHSEQTGTIEGFKTTTVAIANPQKQHVTEYGSEAWLLMDFAQRGYIALTSPDIYNQHYFEPAPRFGGHQGHPHNLDPRAEPAALQDHN